MPLETLFLDAGGVLVYPNWGRLAARLAEGGVRVDAAALAGAELRAKREMDEPARIATSSDADRWALYFELVLAHAGVRPSATSRAALEAMRAYHACQNFWETVPADVVPALERLRAMRLRLVVLSNANGTLHAAFDRIGLARYFDHIVDSTREGVEKPDPRLFLLALARAGGRLETTVHVGDLYHVDVVGARSAGLRGVLLDAGDLYAGHDCIRVQSLAALADLIAAGTL